MSDDDPFEDLDPETYRDREGDPFESLSAPGDEGEQGGDDGGSSDGSPGAFRPDRDGPASDHFESHGDEASDWTDKLGDASASGNADGHGADARGDRDRSVDVAGDPLGDADVSRGDPFESADSPFERVDVGGTDPDEVWDRLTESRGSAADDSADASEADPGDGTGGADDVVTVSKHRFCEGCPHFSSPPAVACGHEGTEILEFVGPDDVRVANCPVVRERRDLGEVHE